MNYLKKYILIALGAVFLAGCDTQELQDLNVNPQAVNEIDLNFLFSAAELGIASNGSSGDNRYIDWRTNIGMASTAIQQLATTGGITNAGDKYQHNAETAAAPFEFTYNDQLKNIAEILKQTGPEGYDAGNKVNMRNAARILRAFSFGRITDFYGNIPYFEANKGIEGIFFPVYDPQQAIYMDLLKELDEAAGAMSTSNPDEGFLVADMIFGSNPWGYSRDEQISKWKKWAYSLMLRMAMRISKVDPGTAATYVNKAIAGGVMTSNEDNVIVPMALSPSEWTNQNGISRAFYPGDGGNQNFLSETLVDWLKGADPATAADDDPRLMILSGGIATWDAAAWTPLNVDPLGQKGLPNGLDQADVDEMFGRPVVLQETYSRMNVLMLQDDEPYMIMHYGEVELLLADAKERGVGNVSGTAKEHYEAGVKAAMQMYTLYDASLTVTDQEVADYLSTYVYGVHKPALQMIGEQLWVSKFMNWWEAWSDWKRTGFPQLTPTNYPNNETNGTIPRRLRYPDREVAGNPNYSTGATLPDLYTTRVWWDVQ